MFKVLISSKNEILVIKHAEGLEPRVLDAMETGLRNGLIIASQDAQQNFIQDGPRLVGELGPGARLRSRSSQLRKSINTRVERQPARVIGQIGSVLKYAAYHEFGFHGVMNVRAHARVTGQFNSKGQAVDTRRRWFDQSGNFLGFRDTRVREAGRQKTGFVTFQLVKAYARRVDYQGKPYIRPALERTDILGEINKAVGKVT